MPVFKDSVLESVLPPAVMPWRLAEADWRNALYPRLRQGDWLKSAGCWSCR